MGGSKAVGVSFQLIGDHPILDFVNTLNSRYEEFGPSEPLNGYETWSYSSRNRSSCRAGS
jgi:hypothetical protein